ncbi:hypothetical protein [Neorhizobium sp. DAR64872/K0K18]|uniref:hypothetical protein n=1 Tax=Neorhizobium sp. DAR64872/K0K18 TaxID=3421958 RepID=UPI003D27B1D6
MSEWTEHDGKGMPVTGDTVVQVRFKGGWTDERHNTFDDASYWHDEQPEASSWVSTEDDDYIVAYRVHSVAPAGAT